jgi:transposase
MPLIKYRVNLNVEERVMLRDLVSRGKHHSQTVLNALILLNSDQGEFQDHKLTNQQIADTLQVSMKKIDRVKKRCVEQSLEAALEKQKGKRVYRKKTDGDFEAHLLAVSCGRPPAGHVRWTLRLLAERMVELEYVDSISHETVRGILKKTKSSLGNGSNG